MSPRQSAAFLKWYRDFVKSWGTPGAYDYSSGFPPSYLEVANRAWEAGVKWREEQGQCPEKLKAAAYPPGAEAAASRPPD